MAEYPIPVFHYQVEWGGNNIGFSEVSGLNLETQEDARYPEIWKHYA
jgi:hypothetical protein